VGSGCASEFSAGRRRREPAGSDAGGISIFTALQQQLGVKLERAEAADRLVVVRAQLPAANWS
jgi:uncharacterized protein (TIGR03435 family)